MIKHMRTKSLIAISLSIWMGFGTAARAADCLSPTINPNQQTLVVSGNSQNGVETKVHGQVYLSNDTDTKATVTLAIRTPGQIPQEVTHTHVIKKHSESALAFSLKENSALWQIVVESTELLSCDAVDAVVTPTP